MPRAYTDVSELDVLAGQLAEAGDQAIEASREFVRDVAPNVQRRMRTEVPVDDGDTRDEITVDIDGDGMGASIGPTNVDNRGRPVGFFIEYGTSDTPPNPFVRRTSEWAARTLPDEAAEMLRDVL